MTRKEMAELDKRLIELTLETENLARRLEKLENDLLDIVATNVRILTEFSTMIHIIRGLLFIFPVLMILGVESSQYVSNLLGF